MDSTLTVAAPLVDFTADAGTVVNHYLAVLSDGQSQVIQPSDDPTAPALSAKFTVSVDGDYTVTLSAIATDGTVIGTPSVSNTVTVSAPTTITVQVPGTPVLSIA